MAVVSSDDQGRLSAAMEVSGGEGQAGDPWDPGSLEDLEAAECWRLLATQPVGRIAVILGHYPLVFPVNFALEGRSIIFRTGAGTKLWAVGRSNVTFEADELDPDHHAGWSVMVKGTAQEISVENSPSVANRSRLAGAAPWAPGSRCRLVRVTADQVSGRRIQPPSVRTTA
jgi:nitroimidazol reductase NimA-like FMN-containing flavoprotein (pyridoxamine 5'-phosphate oxidase superfamily)